MASTKATELAQLSRKLTYNEGTDVATIPTGDILTTGDNTDDLQEGLSNLYFTDARARASISATSPLSYNSTTGVISLDTTSTNGQVDTFTVNTLNFGTLPDAILSWNAVDGTIDLEYDGTGVALQIGQEQHYYGKATEAIANGDVVMFAGVQGDHILFAKADMSATGFIPEWVIGVATQAMALNAFGYVTSFGKVRGINTSTLTAGDLLYLDASTPGALTTTEPSIPNHSILVAAAVNSTTNGIIQVRITHKVALDELHGVDTSTKATGDFVYWNGTNWVNRDADTDDIDEGTTNLYYTDARARAAISAGGDLSYNSTTGVMSFSETTTSLALASNILTYTDEDGTATNIDLSAYLDEDSRSIASGTLNPTTGIVTFTRDDASTFTLDLSALLDDTNLVTSVNGQTGTVVLDTDDVSEGTTNLYYTTARANADFDTKLAAADTDDLSEGATNLYYTDGRVQAVVTQTYINNLNVDADTVDGRHYDDIISEATALAIALG